MHWPDENLRERLQELHDEGLAQEREDQVERAAETFRRALELSRQEDNPLVQLHCRWHYAMLLNELGRCRQGLHALLPLLVENLSVAPEHVDYLCGSMSLGDLRLGAYFAFLTGGLAVPLPRKSIEICLERFRTELELIPGEEREIFHAAYQLCNLQYLLRYGGFREALHAAQMTLAQLPDRSMHGEFLCRAAEACLGLGDIAGARACLERFEEGRDGAWNFSYARVRVALELCQNNVAAARRWAEKALLRSHWEGRRNEKRQAALQFTQVALAAGDCVAGRQGLAELLIHRHGESRLERLELHFCIDDYRRALPALERGSAACGTMHTAVPEHPSACGCRQRFGQRRALHLAKTIDSVAGTALHQEANRRLGRA